ncbi:MAG: helix-turn-helix domain-containing protein [Bdellovibrionales bacterium]
MSNSEDFSQTEINKKIGANLRHFRKSKNVSMADLSDHLGISYQQLQKYETGQNRLRLDSIVRIATFFKVDFNELLQLIIDQPDNKRTIKQSRDVDELLKLWDAIDDEVSKQALIRMLKTMV